MNPDESEKDTMDVQSALDVGVVEPVVSMGQVVGVVYCL